MKKCVMCGADVSDAEPKYEFRYDTKSGNEKRGTLHWNCYPPETLEAWMAKQTDFKKL